jgi:hypothetical protein
MAGYSGTPLPKKLGIASGTRLGSWGAPAGFPSALGELPTGVTTSDISRGRRPLDVLLCFVRSRADLVRMLPVAKARLDPSGGLWICWPKKSSGVVTDVTEDHVRALGLASGLVDNKVCAVDEIWSGLRLVVRLKDRPVREEKTGAPARKTSRKTVKRSVGLGKNPR